MEKNVEVSVSWILDNLSWPHSFDGKFLRISFDISNKPWIFLGVGNIEYKDFTYNYRGNTYYSIGFDIEDIKDIATVYYDKIIDGGIFISKSKEMLNYFKEEMKKDK